MAEIDLSATPRRWAGWIVFAGAIIGGLGAFLILSALNASDRALVVEDGQLYVEKGDFLPWGESAWVPNPAYEPIDVSESQATLLEAHLGECTDDEACERAFYESVLVLAEAALRAEDVARARDLIVRAQLFPGISLAERAPIEDLTGGVHYVEALVLLGQVRDQLELTRKKLERSRISGLETVPEDELALLVQTVSLQLKMLETHRIGRRTRDAAPDPALDSDDDTSGEDAAERDDEGAPARGATDDDRPDDDGPFEFDDAAREDDEGSFFERHIR